MSLNRSSSALLLALWMAAAAFAQDAPAAIAINAERSWVLAGRTLPLQAEVLGEFGEALPGVEVQWASSNPAVARVSADGQVSGLLPGRVIIEAAGSGISGQFTLWVHPARIEITPGRVELEAGGRATLTASALDADGRPLPSTGFTWYSTLPAVAKLESNGTILALAPGAITITARLNVPEGGMNFLGYAQGVVRPRAEFRSERLISSDFTSPATIKAIQSIDYANDRFVFNASLSSGGQALMIYQNGLVRKLLASGEPAANGAAVASIGNVAINARGDVLAQISFINAPNAGAFFPFDKPGEPYFEREPDGRCCMSISPGALADNGDFVFGVWNFSAGSNTEELYISRAGGTAVRVPTDNLPGFGRGSGIKDNARSGGPGQVVFTANAPNRFGLFLWDGRQMSKLIAQGDTVLGKTVDWIGRNMTPSPPGEIYALFGGQGYHRVGRWSAGVWSSVLEGGQQFGDLQLHGINSLAAARDGTLLFDGNSSQGPGLHRFASGQLQRLLSWNAQESNRFLSARQAFLRPDRDAVVAGPWGSNHSRVSRVGSGTETLLYESGRSVDFPAALAVNWNSLGGAGAGGSLITRTSSGALARLGSNTVQLLLSPGDTLADGAIVDWIGASANAPNGDVAVHFGTSRGARLLLLRQQARIEIHGAVNRIQTLAGEEIQGFGNRLGINSRGQIVAAVHIRNTENGFQFEREVLLSETSRQARTLFTPGAAAPGGGTFGGLEDVALDEQGRVWFATTTAPGAQGLFLWDNGAIRRLHTTAETLSDGRRLQTFGGLQFANNRLYFSSWFQNSANALLETDGTRIRYAVSHLDPTSFGSQITGFHNGGQFRVAANGDIAYLAYLSGQSLSLLIRKPDGTDVGVARQNERLGTGPWIENLFDAAWNGDGRLFFTASTFGVTNRIDLYLATPQ